MRMAISVNKSTSRSVGWAMEPNRQPPGSSKSQLLADALESGSNIIVVTIQTFPFALDTISTNMWKLRRTSDDAPQDAAIMCPCVRSRS
jgi:hypothetical protein